MVFLSAERDLGLNNNVFCIFRHLFQLVINTVDLLVACYIVDYLLKRILFRAPYDSLVVDEIVLYWFFFSFERVQSHCDTLVEFIFKIPKDERILSWHCSFELDHALYLLASSKDHVFNRVLDDHRIKWLSLVSFAAMDDVSAFDCSWCLVINGLMKHYCSPTRNHKVEHIIRHEFSHMLLPSFVSL